MLHRGELVELDVDALPFAAKPQLIQLPARVDAPGPVYPLVFVVTVSTVHGFTQGLGQIGRVRKRLDLGSKVVVSTSIYRAWSQPPDPRKMPAQALRGMRLPGFTSINRVRASKCGL